jgi:S1-C subfamily serine protease
MAKVNIKKPLILVALGIVVIISLISGAVADRLLQNSPLDKFLSKKLPISEKKAVKVEGDVSEVVKAVGPSVVTVSATAPRRSVIQFSPFGGLRRETTGGAPQDIGSGFVIGEDGLIVTNKHVVSDDNLTYKVSTSDGKTYDVKTISRDPNNDLAVIKVDASLTPLELGDSSGLEVGQFVIAIGTALGEFRNTVTTGVVSGLGRGIMAGDDFQGYVERLDNVIQTDAAINPGNSGGPLLNASGQVIGVNVAVAAGANNIGFAIPINIVKEALGEFDKTGKFPAKAFLGVEYQMISQQAAILNEIPRGAFVQNVVSGSPAEKAGIENGDIVTKIDGKSIADIDGGLAEIIADKKVGDILKVTVWKDGSEKDASVTLGAVGQ